MSKVRELDIAEHTLGTDAFDALLREVGAESGGYMNVAVTAAQVGVSLVVVVDNYYVGLALTIKRGDDGAYVVERVERGV